MSQKEGFEPPLSQFSWCSVLGMGQLLLRKENAFGANGYLGNGNITKLERQVGSKGSHLAEERYRTKTG